MGHTKVAGQAHLDVNAEETEGGTALMVASEEGHAKVVVQLLDKGADVNAQHKDEARP